MDLINAKNNNLKVGMDATCFTLASSDFEKIPRLANDPIISRQFKKLNHSAYKEIMGNLQD